MEQPGQRQQVGTAAGREIFRNEPVIQRRERIFIRVRCLGEKGFQLFGEGQLTLPLERAMMLVSVLLARMASSAPPPTRSKS